MTHTYKFYFYLDDKIVESKTYKSKNFDDAECKAESYCLKEDYNFYVSHCNITNTDLNN